ncbi:MAG: N-6 DNA methylase [Desulfovibrio sp.]|nr:N-6 DNA methylase [Desulfovibrio sp.]
MQDTPQQHIIEARTHFPRGLEQPKGSLRFGADALLLAAFAARHLPQKAPTFDGARGNPTLVAELGCGCGAALLGLAMRCPQIYGLGLEREKPLVLSAVNNAALLGLSGQLFFTDLDLADGTSLAALRVPDHQAVALKSPTASPVLAARHLGQHPQVLQPACNRLDMVMANPPYDRGGRPSLNHMREHAMRGSDGAQGRAATLDVFCRAAATLLRHHGRFFCIYDAQALPRLCVALNAARLGVRRILPVHTHRDAPALRVLVEARKNAAHDTALEAPLVLHGAPGATHLHGAPTTPNCAGPSWSAEALAFCPWLGPALLSATAKNAYTAQ